MNQAHRRRCAMALLLALLPVTSLHAEERRDASRVRAEAHEDRGNARREQGAPPRPEDRDHDWDRDRDRDRDGGRHDGFREAQWRGEHWYFDGRHWYRPRASGWIVAPPPVGLTIAYLPDAYATLWIGGVPYYYADDIYYRWRPATRDYIVVAPPSGAPTSPPSDPVDVFAYPSNGQDAATQDRDRYECHRWAVERTGFDPLEPNGGVAPADAPARRGAYVRAETACLTGRGYSVR
jgi:hypothetical protein